jgi:hypothetical protein
MGRALLQEEMDRINPTLKPMWRWGFEPELLALKDWTAVILNPEYAGKALHGYWYGLLGAIDEDGSVRWLLKRGVGVSESDVKLDAVSDFSWPDFKSAFQTYLALLTGLPYPEDAGSVSYDDLWDIEYCEANRPAGMPRPSDD